MDVEAYMAERIPLIDRALEMMSETGERLTHAECLRIKANLLAMDSVDRSEVEACLMDSLQVARERGARSSVLRTAMDLGRWWRDDGRPDEARQMVAEVYESFDQGFETPDLKRARALLDSWAST